MFSLHAGADAEAQGSVTVYVSVIVALIVGPIVLVFVCGVIEGLRSGSGCSAPAKVTSRERPSDWWVVGRKGERFRVSVPGDRSQK